MRVIPSISLRVTLACVRPGAVTLTVAGPFGGTTGDSVTGFGPAALHPPKYFSTNSFARSGVMSPAMTIVVKSGRYVAL